MRGLSRCCPHRLFRLRPPPCATSTPIARVLGFVQRATPWLRAATPAALLSSRSLTHTHSYRGEEYTPELTPCARCGLQSEVEETLKRISSHKGVHGILIVNSEGIPIRSTLDPTITTSYAATITDLSAKARSVVRDLDPTVSPLAPSPPRPLAAQRRARRGQQTGCRPCGGASTRAGGVQLACPEGATSRQRALALAFGCARGAPSRIAHLRPPPRARLRVAQNDLTFLRIRSKKHEIMVAPGAPPARGRGRGPRTHARTADTHAGSIAVAPQRGSRE